MSTDHNRLLLQIERAMRMINHETMGSLLPDLSLADFDPVITMVARSRAAYLRELFDLARSCDDAAPTGEQICRLRSLRESYEEQVAGAQALEVAVQRGYLSVLQVDNGV
ncbi:MAG: hypothetical protein P8N02_16100 [Actinomycetota bacterium]|nr:hypothetical protein [Actinomycetota bacterium]